MNTPPKYYWGFLPPRGDLVPAHALFFSGDRVGFLYELTDHFVWYTGHFFWNPDSGDGVRYQGSLAEVKERVVMEHLAGLL